MEKFLPLAGQQDILIVNLYNKTSNFFQNFFQITDDYGEYLPTHETFGLQPATDSFVTESTDPQSGIAAPCVPMVLGIKRERLPDETVVRRSKIEYSDKKFRLIINNFLSYKFK
jgi:hypothetical protein